MALSPKTSTPKKVEIAIIGAGLGGLTAAVELARQGRNVCVFEKELVAGGYAQNFRRKGYHFDVSLNFLGGLSPGEFTHACLDSLGIYEKLKLVVPDDLFKVELPGFEVELPNDGAKIIEVLCEKFPEEKEGIIALFELLPKLKSDFIAPIVNPEFNIPIHDRIGNEYLDKTYSELLKKYISDKNLLSVLGQMWPFLGLPPSQSSANYSAALNVSMFVNGKRGIIGGGAALIRKLIERLRELGGECVIDKRVGKIVVDDGKVKGLILSDSTVVDADIIISGISPHITFKKLLSSQDISQIYRYRLDNMRESLSMYVVHVGLDCRPDELGIKQSAIFVNHSNDSDSAFERVLLGDLENSDYSVNDSVKMGCSISPDGCGVLSFIEPATSEGWLNIDDDSYRIKREEVLELLLHKYEKRFPGLKKHAKVTSFLTPRTFVRYTDNFNGAVFGFAQSVDQSNLRRLSNKTPVKGLFLTGSWTYAGGGYEGAIASGLQTAATVMGENSFDYISTKVSLKKKIIKSDDVVESDKRESQPLIKTGKHIDLNSHYKYIFKLMVYGDELNSRGNADASSYLRYMDRARMEAIEQICSEAKSDSWMDQYQIKIYRIEAKCATIIRLTDELIVRTGLRKISNRRASFDQIIINAKNGMKVVDAVVEVLFLDKDDNLVPVPENLPVTDDTVPDVANEKIEPLPFKDDDLFPFRTKFRVYFEDTDLQGIMFHVSYVRYCERALFDLIRSIWPDASMNQWMAKTNATVGRIDIRYLQSTVLGDRVEVRTTLVNMTLTKLRFGQRIVFVETGQVVADAVTDVDFRDAEGNDLVVPKQIADVAAAHIARFNKKAR